MYQIITLDLINEVEKGYRVSTEIRQKGFSTEIDNKGASPLRLGASPLRLITRASTLAWLCKRAWIRAIHLITGDSGNTILLGTGQSDNTQVNKFPRRISFR
jgi:hypothetical protein